MTDKSIKPIASPLPISFPYVYNHERIMDAARLEADVFRRKYSELSELADVIAAIDQFLSA